MIFSRFKELTNPKGPMAHIDGEIKSFNRLNKNRPQELSSKKPISTFRNIFQSKKKEFIDPRFSSAFGEYKPELFRKSYGFINDIRLREKDVIFKKLKLNNLIFVIVALLRNFYNNLKWKTIFKKRIKLNQL